MSISSSSKLRSPPAFSSGAPRDRTLCGESDPPTSQRLRCALTKTRDSLGVGPDGEPLLPRRQRRADPIQFTETVTTDFDLAITQLEHARRVHGDQRLIHLDAALAHVRGEPFAGWPGSWASEITERAEQAILTGLKLCDPNETLYLAWARLKAARGRPDQIKRIQRRLHAAYAHHDNEIAADSGSPTTATSATKKDDPQIHHPRTSDPVRLLHQRPEDQRSRRRVATRSWLPSHPNHPAVARSWNPCCQGGSQPLEVVPCIEDGRVRCIGLRSLAHGRRSWALVGRPACRERVVETV